MDKDYLLLKRASASRPSGDWNDDDYDVLADGAVDRQARCLLNWNRLTSPVSSVWTAQRSGRKPTPRAKSLPLRARKTTY